MIRYYLPQIIFFCAFFAAAVPVLFYIRRKNPDPRFRPNFGEMTLMTVFAIFICGGMAFGLGSLFKPENDGRSMSKKPDAGAGWSQGMTGGDDGGGRSRGSERSSRDRDDDGGEPPRRRLIDRN